MSKLTSEQSKKAIKNARQEARERVIKRGIVQFRADEEFMEMLLQVSDYKCIPAGVLCRSWIVDILRKEFAAMKSK